MFDFIINFNWINLFAISTSRIHIIINMYFFFSLFLTNHFIFFIYNFKCMMLSTFFIIFAFSFLIFKNMLLTFILYIITLDLSRQKIVILTTHREFEDIFQSSFGRFEKPRTDMFMFSSKVVRNMFELWICPWAAPSTSEIAQEQGFN